MWGLSPALDICAQLDKNEINALCVSQSDCRHVLLTLAKKFEHSDCKLNIYLYEPCIENIARSLLLLSVALGKNIGVGQRAARYLEIYGNTLLRPSTSDYLIDAAHCLIKTVTDLKFAEKVFPMVSLQELKYRERDKLESIFKFWANGRDSFDILTFWNQRVRESLGTRYDSRLGVYDWDLQMRYKPYGADVITIQEYKQFREKGISFLCDDSDPCVPNVSLAKFTAKGTTPIAGYFGDITTGPYPAFGIWSDNKTLFKKINGMYRKSATDISLFNMHQILFEIENQVHFNPLIDDEKFLFSIKQDLTSKITQRKMGQRKSVQTDYYIPCSVPDVQIYMSTGGRLNDLVKKPKFRDFFDIITIPQHMSAEISSHLLTAARNHSIFLVESSKFLLNLNKDSLAKAKTTTDEVMKKIGGQVMPDFDYLNDHFIKYIVKKRCE